MANAIEDASRLISSRLVELDNERTRLEKALSELGGHVKPGPRTGSPVSPAAPKPARRARGKRVPTAKREKAILTFLARNPKAKAKEIAAAVGTTDNYVNNLLSGLRKKGRLVRKADGSQVEVKAGMASSAAAKPAAKSAARKKPGRPKGSGKKRGRKKASSSRRAKKAGPKAAAKSAAGK